ncbi:hypothetical protein FOZ60_012663 [Perkinsus olseni]|uniref:Peptidase A1 domain-containing protein n=1 Tax=Perkinsus olseni TaxID=32597 RepID=A0A7J6PAW6_PEROL|nr:hypothetical protein FOZ60_012663 [Perkinsus olseni]
MSVIRILSLASLVVLVEPEPISLPLTSGRVPLSFDGQALNFELDSGSAMSFAFFGPLYEKAYGKGSCQTSRYGCYVCPSDNPCDDILSRERWEEEFSDGILTIGDTKTPTAPYIALSKRAFAHGILAVPLGRLRLLDSLGNQVEKRRKRGKAKLAAVDTGAMSLFVSEGDFEDIIEMTWEEMRKDEAGLSIPKKGQLLCESTWVRMVRKEALPYLPILGYKIGDPPNTIDIRIEPKHYVHSCDALCCQMDIDSRSLEIDSLGHPVFREYDVGFDLSKRRLYISGGGPSSTAGPSTEHIRSESTGRTKKKPALFGRFFRTLYYRARSGRDPDHTEACRRLGMGSGSSLLSYFTALATDF